MERKSNDSQSWKIDQNNLSGPQKKSNHCFSEQNQKNQQESKKNQKFIRNFWVLEEDEKLRQLVQKYGVKKWTQISSYMPGRSAKRCRERWMNYLDIGKVKTAKWSQHQKWVLYLCYIIHGNRWSTIAAVLNRGDNIVKNQINSLRRRKMFPFQGQLRTILRQPSKYLERQKNTDLEKQLLKQIMAIENIKSRLNINQQISQIENVQQIIRTEQGNRGEQTQQDLVKIEEQQGQMRMTEPSQRNPAPQMPVYDTFQLSPFWWTFHQNQPFMIPFDQYEKLVAIFNGMNGNQQWINSCYMNKQN